MISRSPGDSVAIARSVGVDGLELVLAVTVLEVLGGRVRLELHLPPALHGYPGEVWLQNELGDTGHA